MKNTTIIFAAGGTAGHVFSANGMAYYANCRKIALTDHRGEKYIDKNLFDEVHVLSIKNNLIINFYSFLKSIVQSWKIIKAHKKSSKNIVVIGFGAYVSLPTCFMGWLLKCPLYLYQADQIVGKANRLLSKFSKRVFTSSYNVNIDNSECVGLMPRKGIISYPISEKSNELNILILGGSLSSSFWKWVIPSALYNLPHSVLKNINIHQQVGEDEQYFESAYKNIPLKTVMLDKFVDTTKALPWSNIVIARSGLGTITDLTASMRPALLVPWAKAKDDHQTYNAKWWASSGGGWYASEHEFTSKYLQKFIVKIIESNILREKSQALSNWMPIHGSLLALKIIKQDLKI